MELRGNYRLNASEVLASTEFIGQPFLWKLLGYDTEESLGKNPWIENVDVTWSVFPTKVVIEILIKRKSGAVDKIQIGF